jgi:hypothetical protein
MLPGEHKLENNVTLGWEFGVVVEAARYANLAKKTLLPAPHVPRLAGGHE